MSCKELHGQLCYRFGGGKQEGKCKRVKLLPADWKQIGHAAGPIQNKQMLDYICESAQVLVAFWDDESRGTKNMIEIAKKRNVERGWLLKI